MTGTARVVAAIAPLQREPQVSSPQISQALYGHHVTVTESRGDWHHVRMADGYDGWMHGGYLTVAPGDGAPSGIVQAATIALGGQIRTSDGRLLRVPLGAALAAADEIIAGEAVGPAARATRFPPSAAAAAATATEYFAGTSYQWGGVSPWGADCSGLVQTVLAVHAIPLPRDAWQQARAGAAVDAPIDELRAGDLLFFSDREDGRITHVALATSGQRLVHAALGRGGYAVEQLDALHDPYVTALRARYRFARRLPAGVGLS